MSKLAQDYVQCLQIGTLAKHLKRDAFHFTKNKSHRDLRFYFKHNCSFISLDQRAGAFSRAIMISLTHPSVWFCLFAESVHLSKHRVSVDLGIDGGSCLTPFLKNKSFGIEKETVYITVCRERQLLAI